jgi:hypothetical protein
MRTIALALLLALVGVFAASEPALAHGRSRVSIGVGFGYGWGPYWGPWYYPPPYYYYPVPVAPAQPTTYIEQGSGPADAGGWWYYCDTARGYYPYVKECPSGWQRVPAAPAPAR